MKTIIGILAICVLVFSGAALAEGPPPIDYDVIITTASSVTSFPTPPDNTSRAWIFFEGSAARWTIHDTAPTANLGAVVESGDGVWLDSMSAVRKFQFIMKTGGTGVTAYRTCFGK